MFVAKATRLICDRKPYIIELENGARISTRTVLIATGVQYRRLPVENLSRFEGAGVYYGATFVEAQLCGGEELVVVGGGNSAGQAAVFLAQTARRVHMLVRNPPVCLSMDLKPSSNVHIVLPFSYILKKTYTKGEYLAY